MVRTGTFIALALAGTMLAASPAAAFSWLCTAKDKAGVEYEGRAFALTNDWSRTRANEKALAKCESGGGQACKIKECIDLDALYPKG